jgi:hypothetical protein
MSIELDRGIAFDDGAVTSRAQRSELLFGAEPFVGAEPLQPAD